MYTTSLKHVCEIPYLRGQWSDFLTFCVLSPSDLKRINNPHCVIAALKYVYIFILSRQQLDTAQEASTLSCIHSKLFLFSRSQSVFNPIYIFPIVEATENVPTSSRWYILETVTRQLNDLNERYPLETCRHIRDDRNNPITVCYTAFQTALFGISRFWCSVMRRSNRADYGSLLISDIARLLRIGNGIARSAKYLYSLVRPVTFKETQPILSS